MKFEVIELSGFGKYPKAKCKVTRPPGIFDINELLKNNSVIPRGLGRSYGDASLNDKGVVTESLLMNRFISFDEDTGVLRCEAGVTYLNSRHSVGGKGKSHRQISNCSNKTSIINREQIEPASK